MTRGSLTSLSLVVVLLTGCCVCQESIDTLKPIVKISPARRDNATDRFGFSATVHRIQDVLAGDSLEQALEKTMIMVGAPLGRFPGGISGIEVDALACSKSSLDFENATPQERIECLANFTTGLVYQCPLNSSECGAALGNGSARGPDGYLFDRIGNDPSIITARIDNDDGDENKETQMMGFTTFSNNGVFVACAPFWEHIGIGSRGAQPRGRCVYSGQSLTEFTVLRPCQRGTAFNQNEEGFCLSGLGVNVKQGTSTPEILLGTPSRAFSRGGVVYYENANDMTEIDGTKEVTVLPSIGPADIAGRRGYTNTPAGVSYYGFSITEGYIVDKTYTSFLVGAPRYTEANYLGYIFVVPVGGDYEADPTSISGISIKGQQFGEMFGYSIAAVDLNNDGYDDLVVGAPIYGERNSAELGRVFVFENDQGNGFLNATIITGYQPNSRFGVAVTGLGDLNNDGFKDIAVSAPYEGSGVVYIYHGQEMDSSGSIINTQYKQRIDGESLAKRVSNLTEVKMFGYSLSGSVDVDNNQYNDLVVGAYDSQAVFILRSRPLASVNITLTSNMQEVFLDRFNCIIAGRPMSCFELTLCAMYTGRGIANQFSTMYRLQEVVARRQRLFFDAQMRNSKSESITFNGENTQTCVDVTAYIMNGTTQLADFRVTAEILNIDIPDVTVDTLLVPPDFSALPVIDANPASISVEVAAECGSDDICDSDLQLNITNKTFTGVGGIETSNQQRLIVDGAERVDVFITISNDEEDAFNSILMFALPRNIFTYRAVLPLSSLVTCEDTTPTNTTHDNRMCNLRTPISSTDADIALTLRWDVNNSLTGTEGFVIVPISVMIGPNATRNREMEARLTNNVAVANISIAAESMYTVSISFESDAVTYQGNHTPSVDNIANNLGDRLSLTASFRNQGPSTIRNANLTFYIPTRSPATRDFYFYYPASLSTTSQNVDCSMDGLNPENYRINPSRKKRSLLRKRGGLTRASRQTSSTSDVDCRDSPEDCVRVSCNITNLGLTSVDVSITGFLDERFYNGKESSYELRAYAMGDVLDGFINTPGSTSEDSFKLTISLLTISTTSSNSIPWYVITVPIVAAFIFLVILAVALYFFGFFKRKKGGTEKAEDDEFVAFDANPFGPGPRPGGGATPAADGNKGDPELTKYVTKGKEE